MPKLITGQRLPWKRFWVPWNGNIHCGFDGRGFLDDPDELWGRHANPQALSLDELLRKRCLILSGHPGAGKTVEVERAYKILSEQRREPDGLFLYHCRAISSTEMLRDLTVGDPKWIRARADGGEITLIIDGVDEGLRKVPEFVNALALWLRDEPPSRLRVVLVCRSAEWDVAGGENLMRLWPEAERNGVYELCPLRQQDAMEAARASEIDASEFLKAVFRCQVQGLAARPITLRMLLDEFRLAGSFPHTRKELYRRAARRMCGEFDEERLRALRKHHPAFPEEQVYRTVCRIAALLMLSAKNVVLQRDDEQSSSVDLHWRAAIGGSETADGADFEITAQLVEAALETALFSFRGPHRYGFDHPTFAESLAADYLREVPLVQLRQLMCERFGDREFVAPQLAEVASWLAVENQEWRQFLIANEPAILLRTDVSEFSDDDKELTVASLLGRADREEAFDGESISTFYYALRHPKIPQQLRPYIVDRNRNIVVRRIAIELAGDARVSELEPSLWKLIAANDPAYLSVTHALRDLSGPHSKANLLKALHRKFPDDTNKDLLGVALHILVPKMLPVRAVLPYLEEERQKTHSGSYDTAVWYHLPSNLTVPDLPALLSRMREWKNCFEGHGPFHHLAERGFALALENLDKPLICKLAATMWVKKVHAHEPLPGTSGNAKTSKAAGLGDDASRRQFTRAVLNSDLSTADDVLYCGVALVSQADADWLLTELTRSPIKRREEWAKVTARCLYWAPEREKLHDALLQAYNDVPELRKYLPVPRKGDIYFTLCRCERAAQLRHERREHKWKRERQSPSRRELLSQALNVLRDGNSTGWVGLAQYAYVEDEKDKKLPASRKASDYDLTTTLGWQELSETERKEATHGARRFLIEHDDKRAEPGHYTNYAEAGYHAIRILRHTVVGDAALRNAITRKWIYAVTDRFNNGEEDHQEQIEAVFALAPTRVKARLILEFLNDDKRDGFALCLRAYKKVWCRSLSLTISKLLQQKDLHPRTTRAALHFLAGNDHGVAVSTVRRLLAEAGALSRLSARTRAVVAVALFSLPEEFWSKVWPSIVRAPASTVEQFFLENSYDLVHGEGLAFDKLTDRQVGELHLILMKLFPPETDPRDEPGKVYSVTPRHGMQRLRGGCISMLVRRATDASLSELRRLIQMAPPQRRLSLRWSYAEALKGRLRTQWTSGVPSAQEILTLIRSRSARRVEDEESLREAVLSSLERLQAELDSDGLPSTRDLWNEPTSRRGGKGGPKKEEELSHLIRRWLNKDLPAKNGAIINCEVKVQRFGRGKLDIKVEAISKSPSAPRRMALIIEVKRCCHSDVHAACKTQLVDGYLDEQGHTHGVYLVGWFGSPRGPCAKWSSREQALRCVQTWADNACRDGLSVRGFILDCRLPNLLAPSKRIKGHRKR